MQHDLYGTVDRLNMIAELLKRATIEEVRKEIIPAIERTAEELEQHIDQYFSDETKE